MAQGYIKMYKEWGDYLVFKEQKYTEREAYIWLNSNAYFTVHTKIIEGETITINRGQVSTSYRMLQKEWGWGHETIRVYLSKLEDASLIKIDKPYGWIVITLLNFDNEQGKDEDKSIANPKVTKPKKRGKKGTVDDTEFDTFWSKYRAYQINKGSKHMASTAFKVALTHTSYDTIIKGVDKYISDCHKNKTYTKGVASWLRNQGWDFEDVKTTEDSKDFDDQYARIMGIEK